MEIWIQIPDFFDSNARPNANCRMAIITAVLTLNLGFHFQAHTHDMKYVKKFRALISLKWFFCHLISIRIQTSCFFEFDSTRYFTA